MGSVKSETTTRGPECLRMNRMSEVTGATRGMECLRANRISEVTGATQRNTKKQVVQAQMQVVVGDLENVLGELQTVMGDIKTLVLQIDEITTRIDERCGDSSQVRRHSSSVLEKTPPKVPFLAIRHSISHSADLALKSDFDKYSSDIKSNDSGDYSNDNKSQNTDNCSSKSTKSSTPSSQMKSKNRVLQSPPFLVVPYSGDRSCVVRRNSDISYDRDGVASVISSRNNNSTLRDQGSLSSCTSHESIENASQLNLLNNNNVLNNNYLSEGSIDSLVYTPSKGYDPWLKVSMNDYSAYSSQPENAKVVRKRKQRNSSKRSSLAYSITPSTSTTSTPSAPPIDTTNQASSSSVSADVDYCGVYERELDEKLEMELQDDLDLSDIPDDASEDEFSGTQRVKSLSNWKFNESVSMSTLSSDTESDFGSDRDSLRHFTPRRLNPLIKYTWRTVIEP